MNTFKQDVEQGMSVKELSLKYDISYTTVYKWAKKIGKKLKHTVYNTKDYDKDLIIEILRKYENQSAGLKKACREIIETTTYDLSIPTIIKIARDSNIKFIRGISASYDYNLLKEDVLAGKSAKEISNKHGVEQRIAEYAMEKFRPREEIISWDQSKIINILNKYNGKTSGFSIAYKEIKKEYKDITKYILKKICRINNIEFRKYNYSLLKEDIASGLSVEELCKKHKLRIRDIYYIYKKLNIKRKVWTKVHNRDEIVKILNKYKDEIGGIKIACDEIRRISGLEKLSIATIRRICKENKIKFNRNRIIIDFNALKADVIQGISYQELANKYGVSTGYITDFVREHNLRDKITYEDTRKNMIVKILRDSNCPLTIREIVEGLGMEDKHSSWTNVGIIIRGNKIFKKVTKGKSRPYRYVLVEGK